ncbi:hypothetical protein HDU76_010261 [Blyttiomyces sp. JEL0837]|nr:hypothetical protein HDU76_010261 [Blyttiomyces sp. JEL0837]
MVYCDGSNDIFLIDLAGHNIGWEIPATLATLPHLNQRTIDHNYLSGDIPDSIKNLPVLNVLQNDPRENVPEVSLALLDTLDLSNNSLTGNIPSSLANLAALVTLSLGSNQIEGSIAPEIAQLTNLQKLNLGSNMLSGTIPSSLGNLQKLTTRVLSVNQFSGPLPPALKSLNFTTLKLDDNCVPGKVPLGGNNVVYNGCVTAVPTTKTTAIKPAAYTPKPVEFFPKSMSKYVTKPASPPTPNIYGINGDVQNAICDAASQARNSHCLGICVVQCVGEPYNAWKYLACSGGRVCKKVGRSNICVLPNTSTPATTILPYIQKTTTPTLPQATSGYVAPVPTTTQTTPIGSDKCFDYSMNGPFVPSTGPDLYGPNGDAEGVPCDTEGQLLPDLQMVA